MRLDCEHIEKRIPQTLELILFQRFTHLNHNIMLGICLNISCIVSKYFKVSKVIRVVAVAGHDYRPRRCRPEKFPFDSERIS